MVRRTLRGAALALAFAFGFTMLARDAVAQGNPQEIAFGLPGNSMMSWPELISEKLGFFEANGIKVDIVFTGSDAAGAQQLIAGSLDISEASSTDLIHAVLANAPIRAIIETSTKSPYTVNGGKGLSSIAELKDKKIIVGGPNDITRVFMDKILASAKLRPTDYTYVYAGSTAARFAALLSGGVDAAILFPPFSFRASNAGYSKIADVAKFFPAFLFNTFAVRPDWAAAHSNLVISFTKGYLQGVKWLYDPRNKAQAIQILSQSTNTSMDDATQAYDLVTSLQVFSQNGIPTGHDIAPVLDALVKIGSVQSPLPALSQFYDDRYAKAANVQLRRSK